MALSRVVSSSSIGAGRRVGSLLLSRSSLRCASSASAAEQYAAAPYRLLANSTESQRAAWAERDVVLHAEMRKHVPAALKHNGEEAFDAHLVGVQSVLRSWGAPEYMTNAALFHSIYGTEGFQGYKLPLSHRAEIAALIGPRAERLAWIFCMVDRATVDATLVGPAARQPDSYVDMPPTFGARPELGAFAIPLKSHDEWIDFLTLSLADWLEQVEGAASKSVVLPVGEGNLWELGQAWGYRRHGYAKMAEVLAERGAPWVREAAPRMYAEVFAREPHASRHFVQPLTPPMSKAAVDAHEAIESAGLDFGEQ